MHECQKGNVGKCFAMCSYVGDIFEEFYMLLINLPKEIVT